MNKNHNYLVHYGVKGQKWGVRQYQNYDGSLTPLGREHYGVGQGRKRSADNAKIAGAGEIALMVVATAAATAIRFSPMLIDIGKRAIKNKKAKIFNEKLHKEINADPIDKKTGLHLKSREYTRKEDIAAVNPRFGEWSSAEAGAENNCMLCTSTYDLRRRGYNVTAGMARNGFTEDEIKKWYPKAKIVKLVNKTTDVNKLKIKEPDEVQSILDRQGVGARGNLMLTWPMGGRHSVAYEVEADGKAHIYDTQVNIACNSVDEYFSKNNSRFGGPVFTAFARLDNVDINPKTIKEVVSQDVESEAIRGIQNE